ncbi:MAG: thioredoxin domain-containing protein [Patescibacteria group bacterium]
MNEENKSALTVPMAIVVAGIFIAGAIVVAGKSNSSGTAAIAGGEPTKPAPKEINLRAVTASDHIRGDLNAKVKVVEYSDMECPFCKVFHETMVKIMADYAGNKNVAWVYRHFPIDSLHPKARNEAEATECAYEQGGDVVFWKYLDRIMEITPSNNRLDPVELKNSATFVGINADKLQACLDSKKYAEKVQADEDDAVSAGARGTPYSVVLEINGKKTPIDGALPYEEVKATIESALK